MYFRPTCRDRLRPLIVVALLLSTLSTRAESPDAPAVPKDALSALQLPTDDALDALPPLQGGPPADLSQHDRLALENWVATLSLQNRLLIKSLTESRTTPENYNGSERRTSLDQKNLRISQLREQLQLAQSQISQLQQQIASTASPSATDPPPPDESATAASDLDHPRWKYRFVYEYGLIRIAGGGRVTLRDKQGNVDTTEYSYSEFRRDALWADIYLRNDPPQPMRFTGIIVLQGKPAPFADQRPRLATQGFSTPVLAPGEIYNLSHREIRVEQPWQVDRIAFTDVRAFDSPPHGHDPLR